MVTPPIQAACYITTIMKGLSNLKKLFRFFLRSGRKRRCLLAGVAIRLLKLLRDVEFDEMYRYSDMLGKSDSGMVPVSHQKYTEIEEDYTYSEYALSVLITAIDELEFAY